MPTPRVLSAVSTRLADPAAVKEEERRLTGRGAGSNESGSKADGMSQRVGRIRSALGLDVSLALPEVLQKANTLMGIETEGSLQEQTTKLIESLGLQ